MAHFYVRNSLNYDLSVKFNISFVRVYGKGANDGDPRWVIEVATTYPSASGTEILPQYVNNVNDNIKLDQLVSEAVSNIASQIDWGPLVDDVHAPFVYDILPSIVGGSVPIESNINITIKDSMPSAGIDLSDVSVYLDTGLSTFDITADCIFEGTPFKYKIYWEPPERNYEYYRGQ